MLYVCWKDDRVSNKTIREEIQRRYTVMDLIKQRMDDSRLIKTVLLRLVEGTDPVEDLQGGGRTIL